MHRRQFFRGLFGAAAAIAGSGALSSAVSATSETSGIAPILLPKAGDELVEVAVGPSYVSALEAECQKSGKAIMDMLPAVYSRRPVAVMCGCRDYLSCEHAWPQLLDLHPELRDAIAMRDHLNKMILDTVMLTPMMPAFIPYDSGAPPPSFYPHAPVDEAALLEAATRTPPVYWPMPDPPIEVDTYEQYVEAVAEHRARNKVKAVLEYLLRQDDERARNRVWVTPGE